MIPNDQQMMIVNRMREVTLPTPDKFLIIRETLTRIGRQGEDSSGKPTLIQLCHILHKRGRYFITHYKELFTLDGHASGISEDDLAHRDMIVNLLAEWKLVTILTSPESRPMLRTDSALTIIPHHDKNKWELLTKYQLGYKSTDQKESHS